MCLSFSRLSGAPRFLSAPSCSAAIPSCGQSPPFRSRRAGAVLIEFAISVIVICALLLGLLQYGVYLSVTNSLWNLSREGARFAAVQSSTNANFEQDVKDRVMSLVPSNTQKVNSEGEPTYLITVTPNNAAALTAGSSVTVTVRFDLRTKTFLTFPEVAGLSGRYYTTQTTMRVEGN